VFVTTALEELARNSCVGFNLNSLQGPIQKVENYITCWSPIIFASDDSEVEEVESLNLTVHQLKDFAEFNNEKRSFYLFEA